jgi:hypothetical protein
MAFVKALCVVLLLYSATFGESLQDDNNSEKRAIPPHEMNALAQQIAETNRKIRQIVSVYFM